MKKNITPEQCKDTALALILILLIALRVGGNTGLIMPAVVVLVIAMTWPIFFKPLAIFWFGLADFLSKFVSKIMLTVIFFLIVTPVGLFRKVMGKDSMNFKKYRQNHDSALSSREHKFTATDFNQPF